MASEEDVLLREVDEDLSRDQTFERLRKYQVPLIVGAVAIIAAVAGFEIYQGRAATASTAAAERYAELSFGGNEVDPDALRSFAAENDSGYALLAAMRAAAELGARGDLEAARDLYASVYDDPRASAPLSDFARIRAAYLLFDNRPQDAAAIAGSVETEAFRPHAEEIASAAALKAGSYAAARAGFEALAARADAPPGLVTRARAYAAVADAAASGAAIEPSREAGGAASFIERFGAELEASGITTGAGTEPVLPEVDPESLPEASGDDEAQDAEGQPE